MFGVASDEGFDKSSLADSWRANDGDNNWRRFFRQTIDERDMKTFLFKLDLSSLIRAAHTISRLKTSHKAYLHHVNAQLVWPIDQGLRSQKL